MGYVEKSLIPDEKVIMKGKLHWVTFARVAVTFLIGVLLLFNDSYVCLGGLFLVLAVLQMINAIIQYTQTEFALTNKRIIAKTGGLIRRNSLELLLTKVESIDVRQGILARIFGYGDIVVTGSGGTKERIPFIANAMEMRRQINTQIAKIS